ncbi:hypothetical protein A3E49_01340 [Candidatus Saccharibacteria bacterium RIFCSPHIGHO2_12_FULL_49_19]|nr:MAG: hypothetical protein A3E49_01340 [Candidatus Saccharibacteria bacterium RIFCSPHIGHO2_12_FULL_49_19]
MILSVITALKLNLFTFGVPCPGENFFFLPPWWIYLDSEMDPQGQCMPIVNFPDGIWLIGLAILNMLLRLAGFIAVVSIIVAGVSYIFAVGNPEKAASARRRVYNSLIGLAIVFVATAIVTFVGGRLAP